MSDAEAVAREHLSDLVAGITPADDLEAADRSTIEGWIRSGAPLWRVAKPADPPMHLVAYSVVLDEDHDLLLLADHRLAGLWLPPGGHVEPLEDPWAAVRRECREELGLTAVGSTVSGQRPFFCTVTRTREAQPHTDVSLWYLVRAGAADLGAYDEREFAGIRWVRPGDVLYEPVATLDPAMHRFVGKLLRARERL